MFISSDRLKVIKFLVVLILLAISFGCAASNGMQYGNADQTTFHLIASLSEERIENLYYDDFPENIKELIVKSGIFAELQKAYQEYENDELARFNIIIVLNHKKARSKIEKQLLEETLLFAVMDSSEWVRTEAIWGVGLSGDIKAAPFIIPTLDDASPLVVNEAILSLYKLTSEEEMPISNEDMTDEERALQVEHWKKWWFENKYRWGF